VLKVAYGRQFVAAVVHAAQQDDLVDADKAVRHSNRVNADALSVGDGDDFVLDWPNRA
jgi:hypothetical protein